MTGGVKSCGLAARYTVCYRGVAPEGGAFPGIYTPVLRYGKRGNALSSVPSIDYVWDTIKTSPEDIRRSQQQKFEERMQDERRFLGELEGYGARKDNPRIYISPSQAMVHRYYDDVQ
ncbi:hypothetical protein WN48_01113 [Eufriesea mexicana]|nr:hypothetical protein WN48_01113 [Eufriesea mexicana]